MYRYVKYQTLTWVSIICGILQVALYADFFYLYIKNYKQFIQSDLPTISKSPNDKQKENMF